MTSAPPLSNSSLYKPSLAGLSRRQIASTLLQHGIAEREIRMRVNQLWHWIYHRGAQDFDAMLNVSKTMRTTLAEHFTLARPEIVSEQISIDGTRKWLIRMPSHGKHDRGAEIGLNQGQENQLTTQTSSMPSAVAPQDLYDCCRRKRYL